MTNGSKPSALILGGCGFIGRNVVQFLVEQQLCSRIRVADKVLPATAYLTARQQKAFDQVEFKQANLVSPASIERAFQQDDSKSSWDWVINLAAETKYSLADEIYNEKVLLLSVNCAKEAAKQQCGVFIEVSTAQVYDGDKKSSKEDSKTKPWTCIAKYKLKAEEELAKIPGLNYLIVRPAIVYGPGDMAGISPRLIIGAVYQELKEEMKFLWTKDLRINTVHVIDVARALALLAEFALDPNRKAVVLGQVFNLADKGDTDQEKVNVILRKIYGIQTGYQGTIISNLAKLNLGDVTEEINEKHLKPWSDVCKRFGIANSPLTPYLDQELLYNNSLSVDGSKIEQQCGFHYMYAEITELSIREVLEGFVEVQIFPKQIIQ